MPEGTITDNRTLLAKADLAIADLTSDGGLLQPEQAAKFIRLAIKSSKLLGMVTVTPMRSDKQLIESIRFGSRVLHAGQEATELASGDRSKPTTGKVELDAQLMKGEVRLSNETLEDNIEREELRNTIMTLMTEAVGRDLEELVIAGDTTNADPFLALFNGILAQASSHTYNAAAAMLSRAILKNTLKVVPIEYRRDKSKLRYLTSTNAEISYRDQLADRATTLGDKMTTEDAPVMYSGIPVIDVPLFPENVGGIANRTNVLLCDPKNINVGVRRAIRIETDKDISAGVVKIVVTLRADMKYEVEDAVAKATAVAV